MTRIYCDKHQVMANVYANRDDKNTVLYYSTGKRGHTCDCKFSSEEVKAKKIFVQWVLADGTVLKRIDTPKWVTNENEKRA